MAQNAKQRQKKLAKKAKKRKANLARQKKAPAISKRKASRYTDAPPHEFLMPENLFESGIGTVLFSRKVDRDTIAASAFVVDTFCLGVKNAFFTVAGEYDYNSEIRPIVARGQEGAKILAIDVEAGRKLIDGAVEYARDLGFSPHSDFHAAYRLFGDIDASKSTTTFEYGKDGKPFYIRGPYEDQKKAEQIFDQLMKKCGGPDGFQYLMMVGEHDLDMLEMGDYDESI